MDYEDFDVMTDMMDFEKVADQTYKGKQKELKEQKRRERFEAAKAAMAELVYTDADPSVVAEKSFRYADALLKESDKWQ